MSLHRCEDISCFRQSQGTRDVDGDASGAEQFKNAGRLMFMTWKLKNT